jgi:acyl-CoA synthetase (AMP-forming)/AMP-acid ligase II
VKPDMVRMSVGLEHIDDILWDIDQALAGDLPAVIHGQRRYTWAQTRERSARLAAALQALGVGRGSTVSVMLPNTPEMVEAHYAVPALGAVLNTLNTRFGCRAAGLADEPLRSGGAHHRHRICPHHGQSTGRPAHRARTPRGGD